MAIAGRSGLTRSSLIHSKPSLPMVFCLATEFAGYLGSMRGQVSLKVLQEEDLIWVMTAGADEFLEQKIALIPGITRYVVLPDQQLLPVGKTVPHGYVPSGTWQPLNEWLTIDPPSNGLAGLVSPQLKMQLIPSLTEYPVAGLLSSLEVLKNYVEHAFAPQIEACTFVMNDRQQVLIKGAHLPAIPGQFLHVHEGIYVPAGLMWSPAITPQVLRDLLDLSADEIVLWTSNEMMQRIPAADFVKLTRTAVRASHDKSVVS